MRIIGKCPNCGADDSILFYDCDPKEGNRATCSQCGTIWNNWWQMVFNERHLVPVRIDIERLGVRVVSPTIYDLPCVRLIISVLNTALMVRFKLQVCFATEGGVQGYIEDEPIELRNSHDAIGLFDDYRLSENPVCQKILNWYARVLRILFEEELESFGRGAIIKLLPEDPLYEDKAKVLLWLALCKKTGSKGFANAVFKRMELEFAHSFGGPYVAGLTNKQIARLFAPS